MKIAFSFAAGAAALFAAGATAIATVTAIRTADAESMLPWLLMLGWCGLALAYRGMWLEEMKRRNCGN